VYIAITLLALGALFVDRFLFGGSTAPAEVAAQDTVQEITARVQALSPTGLSIPELPFPRNLTALSDAATVRDLFAPPGPEPASKRGAAAHRQDAAKADAETFTSRNRLEAVLSDRETPMAVVNGKWIRVGQSVDGCTLTRVEGTRAYFQCVEEAIVWDLAKIGDRP